MSTILVVEDNPLVRRLVSRVLQLAGYQVTEATDVPDAQKQFVRQTPDLVLTDLHMTAMDGMALARWVREQKAVPVVMMTADVFRLPTDMPVLTKPFTHQALTDIVRDTLQAAS